MPVYEYSALNSRGKNTTGIIDAESAVAARQKLRASDIFPISVTEVHETAALKTPRRFDWRGSLRRISPAEIAVTTRQLATLLGAGFPLVGAIDAVLTQTRSQALQKNLAKIKDTIVEGNSFAHALELFPRTFSSLYVSMVRAGESSGTLEIVLDRLAEIAEKQQALKTKLRSALAYPILMSLIGALVLFLLLAFIVPSITSIFTDMNRVLPAPTRLLIALSGFFKSYWWLLLLLLAAAVAAVRAYARTPGGRAFFDRWRIRLPLFGPLMKKLAVARFSRTLGSLLDNGVPMLSALDIVKNIAGNVVIRDAVSEAAEQVGKGQSLGSALGQHPVFPDLFIQMVQVGEQSAEMEAMLTKIADVYENEAQSSISAMAALLEPLMILVMAVIVGFIVLAVCLPIFEMNQLVG